MTSTRCNEAAIAQAEGDLPRAGKPLAPLHPGPSSTLALEKLAYQAILERNPATSFRKPKAHTGQARPAVVMQWRITLLVGWAEDIGGDHAAKESWRQARGELGVAKRATGESFSHRRISRS